MMQSLVTLVRYTAMLEGQTIALVDLAQLVTGSFVHNIEEVKAAAAALHMLVLQQKPVDTTVLHSPVLEWEPVGTVGFVARMNPAPVYGLGVVTVESAFVAVAFVASAFVACVLGAFAVALAMFLGLSTDDNDYIRRSSVAARKGSPRLVLPAAVWNAGGHQQASCHRRYCR